MFPREILKAWGQLTRRNWNDMIQFMRRFRHIRGGPGINIKNTPAGITFSIDREFILSGGGRAPFFAQPVTEGPNGEYDCSGAEYWVREMTPVGSSVGGIQFRIKADGLWVPATNILEIGLPVQHMLLGYESFEPEQFAAIMDCTNNTIDYGAAFGALNYSRPIVQVSRLAGESAYHVDPKTGNKLGLYIFSCYVPKFMWEATKQYYFSSVTGLVVGFRFSHRLVPVLDTVAGAEVDFDGLAPFDELP